jgi:hypothetical protein
MGPRSLGPRRLGIPKFRSLQQQFLLAGALVGIGLVSSWLTYSLIRSGTLVRSGSVAQPSDGFYGLELHRGDCNANRVLSIGGGAEGTGYGATSNVNAYGLGSYPRLGTKVSRSTFWL